MAYTIKQQSAQKESAYALINGINLYYEIHGSNDAMPLVLIHGGGSTIESNWAIMLPVLAKNYKVIAMELQAHGHTSDRDTPESFEQDAADVVALLKYLKIKKANIIGFSDGACTTLQMAISYPDMVNKIVLISGNYLREGMVPGFFDGLEKATFADMPQALKDAYLKANPDEQGLLNMFNKDREKRLAFKDRTDDEMKSIKAPALVMAGDRDVITTEHTVQLSKIMADAKLCILPGSHGSFIGEALTLEPRSTIPQYAIGIIEEFLKS